MDWPIVFRAHSEIEASIVRGLLETHGIQSIPSAGPAPSVFPFNVEGLVEVSIAVPPDQADDARRIIAEHEDRVPGGVVIPLERAVQTLERRLHYRFRDVGLLEHALTHKSKAHEDATGGVADNESLEFLGDAVLGFVIADVLFREFPEWDEGQKSKTKAALVSTATLARLAERLQLGDHLLLGRGEEKTGGRRKQALLADGYEALIAAIYLDGGVEDVRQFIRREFSALLDEARRHGVIAGDFKSGLQELVQARNRPLPEYRLVSTLGPDHQKRFEVEVVIGGEPLARGTGRSKKDAEQEAARLALINLNNAG
jgi:ribonuclease-3